MTEDSVTVLKSKIEEEGLSAIVAKRPLLSFFRSPVSVLGSRKVYYPYWCVSLEATASQKLRKAQTVKLLVTVDGVTGDVGYAKKIPEGSQAPAEGVRGRLKLRISKDDAWQKARDFALDLFMRKIFFLEEVSSEISETNLIYYPYWVVDLQKEGKRFRRAVDAIHGELSNKVIHQLNGAEETPSSIR